MASNKEVAKQVVEKVGGAGNVNNAWHCVTRLRFNLNDKNKVQVEEIRNINGVMGAQFSGDQFQVIIGNHVTDVFEEVESLVGGSTNNGGGQKSGEKQGPVSLVMDFISGIFTPILPALAGAGLLKGFLALFVTVGWLSNESDTYAILNAIGDSVFYFLPFFLAVSTAKKMRTNEYLALTVAGTFMYPTLINAYNALQAGEAQKDAFDFLGLGIINIPVIGYAQSVIPIILSIVLLKYVFDFVKKYIHSSISLMFSPMISFLIVIPISLWLVGPLGTNIGNLVADAFAWLFDFSGIIAGALLAGFMPLIIMTGMHYAFTPLVVQSISNFGYDNVVMPMMFLSNIAQGGAALAVFVLSKNKQMKQLGLSSGISAVIGITEPAMYGVNMKLKKPLILAMISSGILGGVAGYFGFKAFQIGGIIGVFSIPIFADPNGDAFNIILAIILFALALILPFILVLIFRFKDVPAEEAAVEATEGEAKQEEEKEDTKARANEPLGKEVMVKSPLSGKIVPLAEVSDPTFSQEIMGKGIAIEPDENRVVSPIAGKVTVFPDSKHAIGIEGDNGEEVLIHIGIDTVSLKGEHFTDFIKVGDRIEVGQKLVEFDREAIREKDIETVTMII
ncbi:PTS beta-glucoside transporter subunit EIIBCA, partial [Gracilibacillus oryzae]